MPARQLRSRVRPFQTEPDDMTNGISETVPAEEFREFKRPVVLAPNPYSSTKASHNVRTKYGDQVMRQVEPQPGDSIGPLDWLKLLPFKPAASSHRLGWVGMEAASCRAGPAFECTPSVRTHHRLVLFTRPPDEMDLRHEGVKRNVPPRAGSISLIPASSAAQVRSSGCKDELHLWLESGLVARVATEAFELDPARLTVPPVDGLNLPHLRAVMEAVDAELTAGGAGGPLSPESLATPLAAPLIRPVPAPRRRAPDGARPRGRLRAVAA